MRSWRASRGLNGAARRAQLRARVRRRRRKSGCPLKAFCEIKQFWFAGDPRSQRAGCRARGRNLMAAPNPQPDLLTFQTMYLCGVAYNADPAVMPNLIQKTQKPPAGGNWRCLWGPAQDSDESNLASSRVTIPPRRLLRSSSASPSAAPTSMSAISGASSSRSGKTLTAPIRSCCRGPKRGRRHASPRGHSTVSRSSRN